MHSDTKSESTGKTDNFKKFAKELLEKFIIAENQKEENTLKFKAWIQRITEPEFSLIPNLLTYFNDDIIEQDNRELIFKLLKRWFIHHPVSVSEQLISNKSFPKTICKYITIENKEKISEDPFFLLTSLYNTGNYIEYINRDFINALFNGLTMVKEESILCNLVTILIEISNTIPSIEDNIVVEIHKTNINSRIMDELLLIILYREVDSEKQIKIMKWIITWIEAHNRIIFYDTDFETFIDIIITKLMTYSDEHLKIQWWFSVERIVKYNIFYQKLYKVEEITDLMEDFQSSHDHSEEVKKISKSIVVNIMEQKAKNDRANNE